MPAPKESLKEPKATPSITGAGVSPPNCPHCAEPPNSPNAKYCFVCGASLLAKTGTYSQRVEVEFKEFLNWLADRAAHGSGVGLLRKMAIVFFLAAETVDKGDRTLPKMIKQIVNDDQTAFNVAMKQAMHEFEEERRSGHGQRPTGETVGL